MVEGLAQKKVSVRGTDWGRGVRTTKFVTCMKFVKHINLKNKRSAWNFL